MRKGQEREYQRLKRLGQQLGIPIFEMFLELEVRDAAGKVIRRHRQRSHSWTRNAYNIMFSQLAGLNANDVTFGPGKLTGKRTSGNVESESYAFGQYSGVSIEALTYGYRALAGQTLWGIVVGSDDQAESFEDYALIALIANGTGAGQMSYVESEAHSRSYDAGTKTFTNELVRYMNNNSGDSIDAKEVALYGNIYLLTSRYFCVARDVLASTVSVPDTGQLKVTYTISLVYPA